MTPPRRPPPETATDRLARLLDMVPWLLARQGIDLDEAAAELGISDDQLDADLELLFLCGSGQMPDELIEAEWEDGRVFVANADTIARPLRLGVDEALTLMVGLRALATVPGLGERDAIERAMAKLEEATGASGEPSARVEVSIDDGAPGAGLLGRRPAGRRGTTGGCTCATSCPARDEATERDVDPMRVVNLDAHWYLEGWCHRAQDIRLFRLDRIAALEVLDVDGTPPPAGAAPRPRRGAVHARRRRPPWSSRPTARGALGRRLLPGRLGASDLRARRPRPPGDPAAVCGPARSCAGWRWRLGGHVRVGRRPI